MGNHRRNIHQEQQIMGITDIRDRIVIRGCWKKASKEFAYLGYSQTSRTPVITLCISNYLNHLTTRHIMSLHRDVTILKIYGNHLIAENSYCGRVRISNKQCSITNLPYTPRPPCYYSLRTHVLVCSSLVSCPPTDCFSAPVSAQLAVYSFAL
jgi:hypothetical protein